jgi:hypothetical protein
VKTRLVLRKAEGMLTDRLEQLQNRVQAGEAALWGDLVQVTATLVSVHGALAPEHGGSLLTTGEMAERLGMSVKTLLNHKHNGTIQPAVAKGKHLRWSGAERLK